MINALDVGFAREAARSCGTTNAAALSQRFADEVCFPPGEYWFAGTAQLPARTGLPPICGVGPTGWPRPSGDTQWEGAITRFTQLDGRSPILQVNGDGLSISGIEFRGRPWSGNAGIGPQVGTQPAAAIVVNGNPPNTPPTGHLSFLDLCFTDFQAAIQTVGTNNADNSTVDNCTFYACGECFRSENAQSVAWKFRGCRTGCWGRHPTLFADLVRGGDITIDGLSANGPEFTLFRVNEYSPNTSILTARDVRWDQPPAPGNYFTAFEYAGDSDVKYKRWLTDIKVSCNNCEVDPKPVVTKWKVPHGLPLDGLKVEVLRGPK